MNLIERDTLSIVKSWCIGFNVSQKTLIHATYSKYNHSENDVEKALKNLCYQGYIVCDFAGNVKIQDTAEETVKQFSDLCHLCGLTCRFENSKDPFGKGVGGLIDAPVSGGFDSTPGNGNGALDDGITYRFSLCEFCVDWLFGQCKIPPVMFGYVSGGEEQEPWRPAAQRVSEDAWRKNKEGFFREFQRRNEARDAARGRK